MLWIFICISRICTYTNTYVFGYNNIIRKTMYIYQRKREFSYYYCWHTSEWVLFMTVVAFKNKKKISFCIFRDEGQQQKMKEILLHFIHGYVSFFIFWKKEEKKSIQLPPPNIYTNLSSFKLFFLFIEVLIN